MERFAPMRPRCRGMRRRFPTRKRGLRFSVRFAPRLPKKATGSVPVPGGLGTAQRFRLIWPCTCGSFNDVNQSTTSARKQEPYPPWGKASSYVMATRLIPPGHESNALSDYSSPLPTLRDLDRNLVRRISSILCPRLRSCQAQTAFFRGAVRSTGFSRASPPKGGTTNGRRAPPIRNSAPPSPQSSARCSTMPSPRATAR